MGQTLQEIAQHLKDTDKKVQLIYAFNGTGKTRLSRVFKELISPKTEEEENTKNKIIYYNAFTEDLFYWDNDLVNDSEPKLKIQPNTFTDWIFLDQGQEQNVISHFQRYSNDKLTPNFNESYTEKDAEGNDIAIKAFSEITFSYERGDQNREENIKISKGEESNLIWTIFYSLIEQAIEVMNVAEEEDRETDIFNDLEYIFIDDPVTSLDENHLIELAVDLANLIKSSESDIKFIITTHNAIFYNVLHNEFNSKHDISGYKPKHSKKYRLEKLEDGTYVLLDQPDDSPFSYHLFLLEELLAAISSGNINKYHFNFLRNILEKSSTFLGYKKWSDLLKNIDSDPKPYETRIINLSSHSKHSEYETASINENEKRVLKFLVEKLIDVYKFKIEEH